MTKSRSSWRSTAAANALELLLDVAPRIYKQVARSLEDEDRNTVLPARTHYRLLGQLHQSPGLSLTGVAQRMGIAKTNASPMVEALVQAGLVNRMVDQHDRRQAQFFLSEAGRKEYEDGMARLSMAFERLINGLPDHEGRELGAAIALVLSVFRELAAPNKLP